MSVEPVRLETPLEVRDLEPLRSGDVVRLYGVLYTARDAAHARIKEAIESGEALPFDPVGQVVYFTGPAPARPGSALGAGGTDYRFQDGPLLAVPDRARLEGDGRQGSAF